MGVSTHVLCFDLGLAFTQGTLDVLIFTSLMTPETFDKVIKRFFEPRVLGLGLANLGQKHGGAHIVSRVINCHKVKSREEE